ncbi:hypothetical protein MTO96_029233 [Rhipicephalus appendiculatus]
MAYVASRRLLSKLYFLEGVTRNATAPCLPALQRRAAGGKADEDDKPYTYTTSNAAKWKAAQSFRTPETNAPPLSAGTPPPVPTEWIPPAWRD